MLRGSMLLRTVRALLCFAAFAVCLTSLHAQSGYEARCVFLTGQVSVLKDGSPIALFQGQDVAPGRTIISGSDGYAKFQLADGSTFEVFQNARVVYREGYPTLGDLIQVWLGRIRVQIDHHLGPNRNRVSTPTAVISVRGTIFDVTTEDQDGTTLVAVEEGAVHVMHRILPSEINLQTNEAIRIFPNQPIARVIDKGGIALKVYQAARRALYDYIMTRPGGSGGGIPGAPGSAGGAQGDKGKGGGTTGGPPPPPGAPPPPPGGN